MIRLPIKLDTMMMMYTIPTSSAPRKLKIKYREPRNAGCSSRCQQLITKASGRANWNISRIQYEGSNSSRAQRNAAVPVIKVTRKNVRQVRRCACGFMSEPKVGNHVFLNKVDYISSSPSLHMRKIFRLSFFLLFATPGVYAQGNLLWSTYYGGPSNEVNPVGGPAVATDDSGNVFLAGYTYSSSGIAAGGFQNTFGGTIDGYLVKFDSTGNRMWATYYGGTGADYVTCVTTDDSGNVYLGGKTSSTTSISSGGFQNTYGGGIFDAFLVKFGPPGNRVWATYYGGAGDDGISCITIDVSGNIIVSGGTASTSGIASGGFQNTPGGNSDAYIVKFDHSGNRLWSTYYGGPGGEGGNSITTDAAGNIYCAGGTNSSAAIASAGAFQTTLSGTSDTYLVKFDAAGNRIWATYYGGPVTENAYGVLTDASGVYVAGTTGSSSGFASNGFQNTYGGGQGDAFLLKFDTAGNRLWATYYGGPANDYALSIAKDAAGNIFISGDSYSSSGIAAGGFQNNLNGLENEFIAKFDSSGNRLCATYFGQSHDEDGHIAVDISGNVYLAGGTLSTTGMSFNGFQNTFGGGGTDSYLAKFGSSCIETSVAEHRNSLPLHVFPNPASDQITIANIPGGHAALTMTDVLGQIIFSAETSGKNLSVNTAAFAPGVYFIQLVNENGERETVKFIRR